MSLIKELLTDYKRGRFIFMCEVKLPLYLYDI